MSGAKGPRSSILSIGSTAGTSIDLICFPHAGAGASVFARWRRFLPPSIAAHALQTPGREDRSGEPPPQSIEEIVALLLPDVPRPGGRPYALFGHSLGALVAFELSRAVRRAGLPMPVSLIVSSAHAPDVRPPDAPISHLPDSAFLNEAARRYGGFTPEALCDAALIEFVGPILRCDIGVYERYRFRPEPAVAHPIVAYGGTADTRVPYHALSGWRWHTKSRFRARVFPGDHFYLRDGLPAVAKAVGDEVHAAVRECSHCAIYPDAS